MQLSARFVANLFAKIIGPSIYDGPRFGGGDPGVGRFIPSRGVRALDRASEVTLNPQPLPPKALYALALADAHIQEILSLDAAGALLGGEVSKRALDRSLRIVADIDELCPRWPAWPKIWPPPPPPPPFHLGDEMTATELFVLGTRFLAAADLVQHENLQGSFVRLGEKALALSADNQREA
jgi:hypothetical protein